VAGQAPHLHGDTALGACRHQKSRSASCRLTPLVGPRATRVASAVRQV
jgi:hypothetical protein